MASPQCGDGYTRIANELLDALCRLHLSNAEWGIVHAIIRKTYGFNKKTDRISASQLAEMTGMARENAARILARLRRRNIIIRAGSVTGLQKDYTKWASVSSASVNTDTKTSVRNTRKVVSKLTHTKDRKTMKDNIQGQKKGDYLDMLVEYGQERKPSYTIPAGAGGADCLGDELVLILCRHLGIASLPEKKRLGWRKALSGIAAEWQATPEQAKAALERLLDPKGDMAFKKYSGPFQQSFANDYGLYLGRACGKGPTTLDPGGVI